MLRKTKKYAREANAKSLLKNNLFNLQSPKFHMITQMKCQMSELITKVSKSRQVFRKSSEGNWSMEKNVLPLNTCLHLLELLHLHGL
jgi:predicted nucleic-acid-binding Zn-ribbon protein